MNKKTLKIKLMKTRLKFLEKTVDSYYFTRILREEGIDCGEHTIFYGPLTQIIDRERPWMLHIGDYCKITQGCIILCHDYSRSVLRRVYGNIIGEAGVTVIGDNCFIGMNSIILMGSQIGNNVIVGAGSVVSGKIPDNVVVAGNPAKIIRTLEDHYEVRMNKTLGEAVLYAKEYYKTYSKPPSIKEMNCFFPLFLERNLSAIKENNIRTRLNGDNEKEVIDAFLHSGDPMFNGINSFLDYCGIPSERTNDP